MKKRLFSILTALCLCLSLLPTAALAEDVQPEPLTEVSVTFPAPKVGEKIRSNIEQATAQPNTGSLPRKDSLYALWEDGERKELINASYEKGRTYMLTFIFRTDASLDALAAVTCNGQPVTLLSGEDAEESVVLEKMRNSVGTQDTYYAYAGENGSQNELRVIAFVYIPLTTAAVSSADTLRAAIADGTDGIVKLTDDITITEGLKIERDVTVDLNGHILRYDEAADPDSIFRVAGGKTLTLTDSRPAAEHTDTTLPAGGLITGGKGFKYDNGAGQSYTYYGGGVYVETGASFVLAGGTIYACGVQSGAQSAYGGGIYAEGGSVTMTGGTIRNCNATWGGGVYVGEKGTFTMSGGSIENCKASSEDGRASGGGIYNAGRTTLSGTAKIRNCQAANAGGGIYDYSILNISDNVEITGCTAPLWSAMIVSGTISGGTFNGTVTSGGTITGGTFNGEVRNVGTITGGTFNSQVTNPGRITGGTFKGGITGTPALATGSGTEDDPYQIGTAIGLKWFRDKVNDASSIDETKICAELTADIDLENEAWTPIGNTDKIDGTDAYSGTFNGKGHTISGLNVMGDLLYVGLFSAVKDGTIRNLTVEGNVSSNSSGGAAGGIVGCALNATIENCSNHCNVAGNSSDVAGGIAGFNIEGAKIIDCYNVGKITLNKLVIGGIAGNNSGTISNCYNVSTLPDEPAVGQIVGDNFGTVENCYYLNTANNQAVGNFAGTVTNTTSKSAEDFADGKVLNLLKEGERGNNADPWADTCQYVDAAGLTLPVFKNQNTHTHNDPLTHVLSKDPTTSEVGNIEYWYCAACGRYFADSTGAKEITKADTVIPKRHFSGSSSSSYPVTAPTQTENGSVTVSPKNASKGSTVTITVTPDSGYVLETISVTDKNGNDLKLTDKGNGKYTFTMPGSKVEIKVTFMEDNSVLNFFYDVPNDAYYYEAVKWAAENGITGGIGNSLFAPNQPCTRAQIVTFLWRVAGSPVVNYLMPFTDVDESAYYAEAVRWAASTGIVTGLTETTFGADGVCTRAQAAAMIYRYAQAQGKGFTGAWMFLLPFTDVPEWAYESVAWCYMNGVTTGVSETAFAPGNDCTRAQIVTFLYRAYQGN